LPKGTKRGRSVWHDEEEAALHRRKMEEGATPEEIGLCESNWLSVAGLSDYPLTEQKGNPKLSWRVKKGGFSAPLGQVVSMRRAAKFSEQAAQRGGTPGAIKRKRGSHEWHQKGPREVHARTNHSRICKKKKMGYGWNESRRSQEAGPA